MFSIVIPVYNKEYSIGRTLESISEQSFKKFELVLVNDGSTDQSLKVINDFINTHPNLDIILIDQKNQGVSVARNVGVANSKYEFICFLDADDNWETDFLSMYNKYIDKYSDAGLWISGYKINNENSVMHLSEGYIDSFFDISSRKTILHTSAVCVRKSILLDIGGFPAGEKVGEDLYVWARIAEKYIFCYIPYCLVNVVQEEDSSRGGRDNVNPYILEYYSVNKDKLRNKELKKYLIYIYFVHLVDLCRKRNFRAWVKRWLFGFKLFPLVTLIIFIPSLIPVSLLKKVKSKL